MEPAVIPSSFIQLPAAAEKIVFASMTFKAAGEEAKWNWNVPVTHAAELVEGLHHWPRSPHATV